jgi:hypothetical protein
MGTIKHARNLRKRAEAEAIERRRAERAARVAPILAAIAEGRAYLETAWGRRKVTGYNDETGWAHTRNDGEREGRSFMVCLEAIKV